MSEALILFAPEDISGPIAWALADANTGAINQRGESGDGPIPALPGARTILILPGADAQTQRLILPANTEAQARAAAAEMFEGAGEEDFHFALGGAQDDAGARLVSAIAPARMTAWLEKVRALGADPHFVVLDWSAWPVHPGEAEIHGADTRVIVTAGAQGGFAIEPSLAPALSLRWLQKLERAPSAIRVSGAAPESWRATLAGATVSVRDVNDAMQELARGAVHLPAYAPNLRQGPFAPQAGRAPPWRVWSLAALLAVLAVLLQVGGLVMAGLHDQQLARQTLADAERIVREARPELGAISNLRAQIRSLANAESQTQRNPVLAVNALLLPALQRQPMARVDDMQHEGPGRTVRVRVSAPQSQALEAFASELQGAGAQVESRVTAPQAGRYVAELTLEAP